MAADSLTVVLLMPRGFAELTEALRHLQAQTVHQAIEVILVHTPAHAAEISRERFAMFRRFTAIEVAGIPTVASGYVAAFDVATGDVVAHLEDHVFLEPRWAERILAAHRQPSAAVAPAMLNANPTTAISWANFLASFAEAAASRPAGPVESGPGHNTSYKRAVLKQYRRDLVEWYQSERAFHYRLRSDGHVILHEPQARLAHLNISVGREAVRHGFLGGVLFGTYRGRQMAAVEKVARTALAPLVPPVRLWRTLRMVAGRGTAPGMEVPVLTWALFPVLLLAHAAGEAVGYWNIVGDIELQYEHFELHRLECLRVDEHRLMTGVGQG